jgi:hypothetical protein
MLSINCWTQVALYTEGVSKSAENIQQKAASYDKVEFRQEIVLWAHFFKSNQAKYFLKL